MKTIVSGGARGADIDVFACAIAYVELLRLEGKEAKAVILGSLTSSVTPSVLAWNAAYDTNYAPNTVDHFVQVDISDPAHFPAFVDHARLDEVYDHRHGHEDYWHKKLGTNAHIEMVGSCGTLIWEQFKQRGKDPLISDTSAKLLLASIVSNTLAFRASNTTARDKAAYAELSAKTGLGEEWIKAYYAEQETMLLGDFEQYVRADVKDGDFVLAQIDGVWDADALLSTKSEELGRIMAEFNPKPWAVNIPNIAKGFSYIYSNSKEGREMFERKVGVRFDGNLATTDGLLLRKHLAKLLWK